MLALIGCNAFIENAFTNKLKRDLWRAMKRAIVYFVISLLSCLNEPYFWQSIIGAVVILLATIGYEHKIEGKSSKYLKLMGIQLFVILFLWALKFGIFQNAFIHFAKNEFVLDGRFLKYTLAYVFCLTPSNLIIKGLINKYVESPPMDVELEKGGRFLGSIERIITLSLVINNQFEAIGLLVAAKSILRTNDKKVEYVIIGNLLSFGIAIVVGIILIWSVS